MEGSDVALLFRQVVDRDMNSENKFLERCCLRFSVIFSSFYVQRVVACLLVTAALSHIWCPAP